MNSVDEARRVLLKDMEKHQAYIELLETGSAFGGDWCRCGAGIGFSIYNGGQGYYSSNIPVSEDIKKVFIQSAIKENKDKLNTIKKALEALESA